MRYYKQHHFYHDQVKFYRKSKLLGTYYLIKTPFYGIFKAFSLNGVLIENSGFNQVLLRVSAHCDKYFNTKFFCCGNSCSISIPLGYFSAVGRIHLISSEIVCSTSRHIARLGHAFSVLKSIFCLPLYCFVQVFCDCPRFLFPIIQDLGQLSKD